MENKTNSNSPVGVLEDYFRTQEESSSSSSKEPTSESEPLKTSKPISRWHDFVKLLSTKSKKPLATLHPLSVLKLSLRRSSSIRERVSNLFPYSDSLSLNSQSINFNISELQSATNNFSPDNLIGKGGYAEVYKGCLRNGKFVAIKRITKGTADEKVGDFLSEIGIMAHVNHPNTAKLIGYGIEGGMHLVLQLSPYGSLASVLYGSKEMLTWDIRYKIALGTAEGIRYLHEDCQRRIIHRDIKAANILLSADFVPQICDFGLAKWLPENWTHHIVSKFEGTFGYLAPEYLMHGIVDEKTDVFAFGVVLLELVTGRRALDYSQQSLVLWAKPLLKKNEIRELIDGDLEQDYDTRQMNLMLLAASLCIQQSSLKRPKIAMVVQILKGNLSCLKSWRKSRGAFFRKAFSEELSKTEEY
ncbi:Protein kinase family protein [Euphorbia peplus]|nr:Protein kinase family protein [Euphorbia peplus]